MSKEYRCRDCYFHDTDDTIYGPSCFIEPKPISRAASTAACQKLKLTARAKADGPA